MTLRGSRMTVGSESDPGVIVPNGGGGSSRMFHKDSLNTRPTKCVLSARVCLFNALPLDISALCKSVQNIQFKLYLGNTIIK
ncbi:unnamed protein product, partial [Brenthis ino]